MCWESQVVSSDLRVLSCGWQDGTRGDPCYGRRAVWRKGGCLVPWDHVYWVRWVNTLPLMWDVNKELSPIIVGRFKKKKKKRFLFLKVYASKSYLESSDSWIKLNWVKVANQGQGTNNAAVLLCSSSVQVQDRPHFAGLFCKCWASFIDSSEVSFSFQTNARGCQASFTEKQDFGAYGNWAPYMTSTFISPIFLFPQYLISPCSFSVLGKASSWKCQLFSQVIPNMWTQNGVRIVEVMLCVHIAASQSKERVYERILNT